MLENTLFLAVIVAFLAVVIVRKSVIIVRQGYEYTVERFGKYSTTFEPGFHFMLPFINRIGQRVNMMGARPGRTITRGYLQRQRGSDR